MKQSVLTRMVLSLILVSLAILTASAAMKPAKPVIKRGLTFHVTYDKRSTTADFAKGNPASTTKDINLEFRLFPGFNNKNAFNIAQDEELKYDPLNNVSPHKGTVIMWAMANNYSPNTVKTSDLKKSHKQHVNFYLKDRKGNWVHMFLYQYFSNSTIYFYWNNSSQPKEHGYKLAAGSLKSVRKKQWYQVAATWDEKELKFFLNGKLASRTQLPSSAKDTFNLKPDPKKSFLGIRFNHWKKLDTGAQLVVDDLLIYDRALTDVEIAKQYAVSAGKNANMADMPNIAIRLDGVDLMKGPINTLRADIDYAGLDEKWHKAIAAKKVKASATLTDAKGKAQKAAWTVSGSEETRFFKNVSVPGKYTLALTLKSAGLKDEKVKKDVVRPDTSWLGNGLGAEDVVPKPWTPMTVSDDNVVSVWNRTLHFDDHPLPRKITHGGDSLLASPPEIVVVTDKGKAKIAWKLTKKDVHKSWVTFTGEGKAKDFTVTWTTRVDFDGTLRCDYKFHGKPKVRDLKLTWTVDRKFSEYLMTPLLSMEGNGSWSTAYPRGQRITPDVVWLTSNKKGFAWSPEHDANWIYDNAKEKPISVRVDKKGGHCTIQMINREVTLPEGTGYHAIFTATPSRPLPKDWRTFRLGGYNRQPNCHYTLSHHSGSGFDGVFSYRPSKDFGKCIAQMKKYKRKNIIAYGGATALNDYCAEGKYFDRYWGIPSGPKVPFIDRLSNIKSMQTNICPRTRYSDYIMDNFRRLFDHPLQMHKGIYYDLASNYQCDNALHGCKFKDAFGREVSRLVMWGLRKHIMRTMKYCHSRGRIVVLHSHSFFMPMVHGLGDYWFPGEQYSSLMMRKKTPYVYSDVIGESVYRTELSSKIKGVGISFLGQLKRANRSYGTVDQTKAMCAKLLLNDVPMAMAYEDEPTINKVWGVTLDYKLDSSKFVAYYDKANRIKSSNPKIAVSYHLCADGRVLAIAANMSKTAQKGVIDLSGVKAKIAAARDAYEDKDMAVTGGKVRVNIPARHFILIGF
jgi:Concanavalin A-like lectin/glucanases superfamily/Glycoside hydrolase 123, N-terminal domain